MLRALSTSLVLSLIFACASSPPSPSSPSDERPAGSSADVSPTPVGASGAAGASSQPAKSLADAVVTAPDRDPADVALDAGRKPAELLEFAGVQPGMKVADLGTGGGYTAELLARAVGPTGKVWAQNNKMLLERFAEKPWSERLKKPAMQHVVRVDREFDDPLPPDAKDLDVVTMVLFYHDTVWMGVDRAKMNKAIFDALKPGGSFIVIDHSARDGSGLKDVETLHRIEERLVIDEIVAAGFEPGSRATFLQNAGDARDWNASPRAAGDKRGQSDRFVLEFKKRAP